MTTNVLMHHGVKGQKWGVRRYQNSDGTLTAAGKRRYQYNDGTLKTKAVRDFAQESYMDEARKQKISSDVKILKDYAKNKYSNASLEQNVKVAKSYLSKMGIDTSSTSAQSVSLHKKISSAKKAAIGVGVGAGLGGLTLGALAGFGGGRLWAVVEMFGGR